MRTFVEKPKVTQQTTLANRAHFGQSHDVSSILHLQRTIGNQAVQRMLRTNTEDGKGDSNATFARFGHDFSKIPVVPPDRAASTASSDNNWGMRSIVTQHRHRFSAVIRHVSPAFQSDSMSADEREPAMDFEAQATQTPIAPLAGSIAEPVDGETVLFPTEGLQSVTLPGQSDKIESAFGYKSSIKPTAAPRKPGKFGETNPYFAFEKPGPSATQTAGTFKVTGTIEARITFWVDSGGRTDIASDSDPDITQHNYPTVVSDLTPSPKAVNSGGLKLYKNQPPRTKFWAEDLTIKHEGFHADENVKFGQEGVTLAQNWLNKQTARTYDDVGALLDRVNPMIAKKVDTEMALPGRELRAYDDGAPDYLARAQAVKRKGDANGYVPKPPAPQAPSSPPAATPKAPSTPSAPARNEPAPK